MSGILLGATGTLGGFGANPTLWDSEGFEDDADRSQYIFFTNDSSGADRRVYFLISTHWKSGQSTNPPFSITEILINGGTAFEQTATILEQRTFGTPGTSISPHVAIAQVDVSSVISVTSVKVTYNVTVNACTVGMVSYRKTDGSSISTIGVTSSGFATSGQAILLPTVQGGIILGAGITLSNLPFTTLLDDVDGQFTSLRLNQHDSETGNVFRITSNLSTGGDRVVKIVGATSGTFAVLAGISIR